MKDETKIWKPVKGYEGVYEISEYGDVYSIYYKKYHKAHINKFGYNRITLKHKNVVKNIFIHRLVILNFIGHEPNKEVNHIDGNKLNNHYTNLEWITRSENQKHAFRLGLQSNVGTKCPTNILSEKQVYEIRDKYKLGVTIREMMAEYGVSNGAIRGIVTRKNWKHLLDKNHEEVRA